MKIEAASIMTVPLGAEAHRRAGQFAIEQSTPAKSKQVYLNTLAVYAVHRYLTWCQIETDLTASDSWNSVLRGRWNIADLKLPGIGKVECCCLEPGATTFRVSPEAVEDRIAYLAVQVEEALDRSKILGFVRAEDEIDRSAQPFQVADLQPLGTFLHYLEWRQQEFPSHLPLPQEKISVGNWLRETSLERLYRSDRLMPQALHYPLPELGNPSWTFIGAPVAATKRFVTGNEMDAIAWELKQQAKIDLPESCRCGYRDLELAGEHLRLYAITWLLPDAEPEEWVLLLILGAKRGSQISKPCKLQIWDWHQRLDEQILQPNDVGAYKIAQVAGALDEQFLVTLALLEGGEPTTLSFEF